MGQQQLLLIVLGIIIVGIAIAVGVTMFQSSAVDTNRQSVISDMANLAAKAQRFYRTPTQLGGGAQDFNGFRLGTLDCENANGSYRVFTAAPDATSDAAPADTTSNISVGSAASTIYIYGWGKENGDRDDSTMPVQGYVTVTGNGMTTTIVN